MRDVGHDGLDQVIMTSRKTLERATATVKRAVGDAALAPLWSAPRLLREVPFLLPCRESFVSGKIDAITEDELGALTIFDYKTGHWDPAQRAGLERAHRAQALVYALAAAQITKCDVHSVRLLFLSAEPVEEIENDHVLRTQTGGERGGRMRSDSLAQARRGLGNAGIERHRETSLSVVAAAWNRRANSGPRSAAAW